MQRERRCEGDGCQRSSAGGDFFSRPAKKIGSCGAIVSCSPGRLLCIVALVLALCYISSQ